MAAPPYYFADLNGGPALDNAAQYLVSGRIYRFPPGHRLAGDQTISTMEPMRQDLFRLFVRLECDAEAFKSFLSHGIQELLLPFSSLHVKTHAIWLDSAGVLHSGVDWNDAPQTLHPYPNHPARTFFQVLAVADGTVVGWDETKLLTLEHVSRGGKLYRTIYNMMRKVPVAPASGNLLDLGVVVTAGEVIGEAWNPPPRPLTNIHLHFGFAVPHTIPAGWSPNLNPLFGQLSKHFEVSFSPTQQQNILSALSQAQTPWQRTEWFFIDPFGRYDTFSSSKATYGPLGRGFYYPVPTGSGTYAFQDTAIAGDPGGDRIPLFAASQALLDNVSAGPLSLATLAAVCE